MMKQTENGIEYLGTTILVVLFFLFFTASHQNSNKPYNPLRIQYQISSVTTPAVLSKDFSQLTCLQKFIPLLDASNHKHEYRDLKIISDNRLINQRILSIHKVEFKIKPAPQGFYYYYQSLYSEDIPNLS
jgi:hypothetical protein